MTLPSVSVVVLNRDRIRSLARTLLALRLQTHRGFDVVVVSNQPARIAAEIPLLHKTTTITCAEANISRARNLGVRAAAGQIIAFCDDDAVPEPTWLESLIAPFDAPDVGAVGGLVRGRNGISLQWGLQEVDSFGNDWPASDRAPGRVFKTVGTNCAFRRAALAQMGGFDEAYRFFLDETDANWRLAEAGWRNLPAPGAEVHHSYGPSALRSSERIPTSLLEIGASKVHFCQQHGAPARMAEELDGFRQDQRRRLLRAMHLGLLPPTRVSPLLASLEEGYLKGAARTPVLPGIDQPGRETAGQPFATGRPPESRVMTGPRWRRRALRRQAAQAAETGEMTVTLLEYEISARPLTVRFTDQGYWLHSGGIFGQRERGTALFRFGTRASWLETEISRVAQQRKISKPTKSFGNPLG